MRTEFIPKKWNIFWHPLKLIWFQFFFRKVFSNFVFFNSCMSNRNCLELKFSNPPNLDSCRVETRDTRLDSILVRLSTIWDSTRLFSFASSKLDSTRLDTNSPPSFGGLLLRKLDHHLNTYYCNECAEKYDVQNMIIAQNEEDDSSSIDKLIDFCSSF